MWSVTGMYFCDRCFSWFIIKLWLNPEDPSPKITCVSLSLSTTEPFLPFQCSYSSRTSRCFCVLDHNEDEIRSVHFAFLCVTSIAGNTTSSLQHFTPMGICELIQGSWRSAGMMELHLLKTFLFRTHKIQSYMFESFLIIQYISRVSHVFWDCTVLFPQ